MADFLLILPVLLFSVVAHEYAHAWTAHRQGDPTAMQLGRLTFNPIPHIDPVMSLAVPALLWWISGGAFTFGAARPVPVNPRNYRNYRRGDLIVSSAGIAMNLALAVACAALFVVIGFAGKYLPGVIELAGTLQRVAVLGIFINLLLAFFNLVPVPPLDGSHLLYHLLPPAWGARYRRLGGYGFLALVLALWMVPGVWRVLLWPVSALTTLAQAAIGPYALPTMP